MVVELAVLQRLAPEVIIAAFGEFVRHELRGHMDVVEMLVE